MPIAFFVATNDTARHPSRPVSQPSLRHSSYSAHNFRQTPKLLKPAATPATSSLGNTNLRRTVYPMPRRPQHTIDDISDNLYGRPKPKLSHKPRHKRKKRSRAEDTSHHQKQTYSNQNNNHVSHLPSICYLLEPPSTLESATSSALAPRVFPTPFRDS